MVSVSSFTQKMFLKLDFEREGDHSLWKKQKGVDKLLPDFVPAGFQRRISLGFYMGDAISVLHLYSNWRIGTLH